MAGHDYMTQAEVSKIDGYQKWTVNFDGTIDETGTVTRGAVDTFFMADDASNTDHYRQVLITLVRTSSLHSPSSPSGPQWRCSPSCRRQ